MSVDILGTSWDQCLSMVSYSFTSTETIRLVRTDSPGRPPRLSHSSWTRIERDKRRISITGCPQLPLRCAILVYDTLSRLRLKQPQGQESCRRSSWQRAKPAQQYSDLLSSTGQENNIVQPKTDKWFSFWSHFFYRFWPFNCCLSVVLQLDKGDYLENLQIMFLSY